MLINAVLVYTRELLPVLLLLATLLRLERQLQLRIVIISLIVSVVLMLLLAPMLKQITQLAEGNGLELLFVSAYLLTLAALLLFCVVPKWALPAAVIALSAQAVLCGTNLLLYGLTSPETIGAAGSIWLGAVLGCGIGLSIAVLWYQLLAELERFGSVGQGLMLALISARQTGAALALFMQIDWLSADKLLWDTSKVISEQSEIGVFFQAWFGYEATPDVQQLSGWLLTLVLVFVLWQWRRQTT